LHAVAIIAPDARPSRACGQPPSLRATSLQADRVEKNLNISRKC